MGLALGGGVACGEGAPQLQPEHRYHLWLSLKTFAPKVLNN
jgi:hypothetical protein